MYDLYDPQQPDETRGVHSSVLHCKTIKYDNIVQMDFIYNKSYNENRIQWFLLDPSIPSLYHRYDPCTISLTNKWHLVIQLLFPKDICSYIYKQMILYAMVFFLYEDERYWKDRELYHYNERNQCLKKLINDYVYSSSIIK